MWKIGGKKLKSRLMLGSSLYPSLEIMKKSIKESKTEIITVSLRRQKKENQVFWNILKKINCIILPNTSGCFSIKETILIAKMAREIFETNYIKLEIIGDDYNLQPNPFLLLKATEKLISMNFIVFPFCTDDLVLCNHLVNLGCDILMPWGSPIGSGKGILNTESLKTLRKRFPEINLIIDAGIGKPSHAMQAMELGYDGLLINSAIALSHNPIKMAKSFSLAVKSGRMAYKAGFMPERSFASPSTPILGTPFWRKNKK